MPERMFTPQQREAIDTRGKTLLVSAAAGSGKTAVLVERVLQMICDEEHPCDADRLLIATFSNLAASEMKTRIQQALGQKIAKDPQNAYLKRQRMLVSRAHIGTVHAFCLELMHTHFEELDLSPDFRVADESERSVLMEQALEETLEYHYTSEQNRDFLDLMEMVSSMRDDKRLKDMILQLYEFTRSHPFPHEWMAKKLDMYQSCQGVLKSAWGQVIAGYANEALLQAKQSLKRAIDIILEDERLCKAYLSAFQSDVLQIEGILQALTQDYDLARERLKGYIPERLGALRGYEDENTKERLKAVREKVKKTVAQLGQRVFCTSEEQFLCDLSEQQGKIRALFDAVRHFEETFGKLKKARKVVDFGDIEHYAIALLVKNEGGVITPTKLALELCEQFEEVMVDEYQDTNYAQELIFKAVSNNGQKLFMVGDVKQSIYRFRQAMPAIFLSKKEAFPLLKEGERQAKILLSKNFRSRSQVLSCINFVFEQVMSRDIGEIVYNEEERLIPGASYPPGENAGMQVHLIDMLDAPEDADATAQEAQYVASLIKAMLDKGERVLKNGQMAPIAPEDICILLRSTKNRAKVYQKALADVGVFSQSGYDGGFFDTREIRLALSLLKAVDNPLLDIPLCSVMLSPLGAFTPDELALLRAKDPKKPVFLALNEASADNPKAKALLEMLKTFREWSLAMPVHALIPAIFEQCDFYSLLRVMAPKSDSEHNLQVLCTLALDFEKMGSQSLAGFVRFLERMERLGGDLGKGGQTGAGGVQIMSIHKSKGLEFPVCFLCGLARKFNKEDVKGNALIHSELGFSCMARDLELGAQYSTLPHEALKLKIEQDNLSEDMRILYVALTRAKERLILTGAFANLKKRVQALSQVLDEDLAVSPFAVRDASCLGDWVLLAILRHPAAKGLLAFAGVEPLPLKGEDVPLQVAIPSLGQSDGAQEQAAPVFVAHADEALLCKLRARINWRYPYGQATVLPAKLGVSDIAHQGEENAFVRVPAFASYNRATPTQVGNAMHKFMQFADYAGAFQDLDEEIARLENAEFLSHEECRLLNRPKLQIFFASPLYKRMQKAKDLKRELPFIMQIDAGELDAQAYGGLSGESVTVQGIADCVVIEENGFYIVDYKTDRLKEPSQFLSRYAGQLKLYKRALEQGLGMPCKGMVLYSFYLDESILVV